MDEIPRGRKETLEHIDTLNKKIASFESENAELKAEVQQKTNAIAELTRFAGNYNARSKWYALEQKAWFKYSVWAATALVISILVTLLGPLLLRGFFIIALEWIWKPGLYLLNAVFITLL